MGVFHCLKSSTARSLVCVFIYICKRQKERRQRPICVSGGCFERALSLGLRENEYMNTHNVNELEYRRKVQPEKADRMKHFELMFWVCAGVCLSQGDTVLVGGPSGEKGNKGETVSEQLDE